MADVFKSTIRIGKRRILLIQSVLGEKLRTGPVHFLSTSLLDASNSLFSSVTLTNFQ